jgi:hypothetical protein
MYLTPLLSAASIAARWRCGDESLGQYYSGKSVRSWKYTSVL